MKDILSPSLSTKLVDQVAAVMKSGAEASATKLEEAVVDTSRVDDTSKYMSGFKQGTTSYVQEGRISWNDMRNALLEAGHPALIVRNMDNQKLRIAFERLEEGRKKLVGDQHKIDKNKNGKIDAHDFKLLRKEEAEEIEEGQGSFSRLSPMGKKQKDSWKPNSKKPRKDFDRDKRTVKEPVDEETLDELSRKTLGSYALKSIKAEREHDRNYEDRQAGNRRKGLKAAINKMAKEEVETIDETTSGFRNRYQTLARAVIAKNKNNRSQKAAERIRKRTAGMSSAGALNQKEANKRWDAEQAKEKEVHDHITKKMPGILKAHGYEHVGQTGKWNPHTLFVKNHPEHGVSTHVKLYHERPDGNLLGRTVAKFGSTTGWQSSDDSHNAEPSNWDRFKRDIPVAERKKAAEDHFADKIKTHETYHKQKALEESVAELDTLDILSEDLSEALVGKVARSAVQAGLVYAKHHEEINDLLKGISTHLKSHAKDAAANPWGNGEDHKGPHWGHVGSVEHYRNQLQNIHDSLAGRGQYAEDMDYDGDELNEELTEAEWIALEEAKRGRPRKNPLPEPKKQAPSKLKGMDMDDEDEEEDMGPEANLHIMNQIHKAADSGLKPYHVAFGDGSRHPVTRSQARKIMSKYQSLKPADKEAMQAHMGQSHANLLTHLS
jgi:hypothetical protein